MESQAVILVTTLCNRQCVNCCYQIPAHRTLPAEHYGWSYFEEAARWLGGLSRLTVSGGEPTLHPEFPRIAQEFRALFKCRRLMLATNGARVVEYSAYLHYFDEVRVTMFGDAADGDAIRWLQKHDPRRLQIHSAAHLVLERSGKGQPCGRQDIPAYAAGRLYPCCVAPGIVNVPSVEPSANWRQQLSALPLPCARCPFSV